MGSIYLSLGLAVISTAVVVGGYLAMVRKLEPAVEKLTAATHDLKVAVATIDVRVSHLEDSGVHHIINAPEHITDPPTSRHSRRKRKTEKE
jgi:hypothetical protein